MVGEVVGLTVGESVGDAVGELVGEVKPSYSEVFSTRVQHALELARSQ